MQEVSQETPTPVPPRRRQRGRLSQLFRSKVRPIFSRRLSHLATVVLPPLYMFYMRLVWATSRVESREFLALKEIIVKYNGAVGLLWHEEVMTVAFGYY